MFDLYDRLIETLLPGRILGVQVGQHRTAVLAETDAGVRCGLAATLSDPGCTHLSRPSVRHAGRLHEMSAAELAGLVKSDSITEVSIGMAAINALLPRATDRWVDLHSREALARLGRDKTVVMVGHFPFVEALRPEVGRLLVLELDPRDDGDIPAEHAPDIIPQADVVAITAMTLLNRTFDHLIDLCRPGVPVVVIGPSTPLSPVLFDRGATILSGAIAENPVAVMRGVGEGANSRQLRQLGLRFVSITAERMA